MKRIIWIFLVVAVCVVRGNSQQTSTNTVPVFMINGPTIVAFYAPVTAKDMEDDSDSNEALSDFQFYNGEVSTPLHKAGIEFDETDTRQFRIRIGKTVSTYGTGKYGIGYFFIAPGKKPHIVYKVMDDEELLDTARKYFELAIR